MSKYKKAIIISFALIVSIVCVLYLCLIFFGNTNLHFNSEGEKGDIKVACVGDSITYGATVSNWYFNNYPRQLDKLLGDGYNVANFGASNRTATYTGDVPYSEEKIYQESLAFNPDIVVIMFGTNDSKFYNWPGKEEFKSQYEDLIESYLALESEPAIFIGTPATVFYVKENKAGPTTIEAMNNVIDEERDAVYEIAEEKDLNVIDINTYTKNHPEWFGIDGVHPDADGAKEMASFIYKQIKGREEKVF